MNKEFNLSEKIFDGANTEGWHKGIKIEDVKEFINILKKETKYPKCNCDSCLHQLIDDLAGEQLK